ncbi:MFS transporter [Roseomonas harenae]|nr:MFS transporter [Roseomonas harenae]
MPASHADALTHAAALVTAAIMGLLAFGPPGVLALPLLLLLGAAWIFALATLNGTAQAILPNRVRGRVLAVYLTVFNGAMAAGSLGWARWRRPRVFRAPCSSRRRGWRSPPWCCTG